MPVNGSGNYQAAYDQAYIFNLMMKLARGELCEVPQPACNQDKRVNLLVRNLRVRGLLVYSVATNSYWPRKEYYLKLEQWKWMGQHPSWASR